MVFSSTEISTKVNSYTTFDNHAAQAATPDLQNVSINFDMDDLL